MGAAGDMLGAALLELFGDGKAVIEKLNSLGIPKVKYIAESAEKCGIKGTHLSVKVDGEEEDEHMHEHGHSHHSASSLNDIKNIVSSLNAPEKVKSDINAVYALLADAESKAHGVPVSEVHFHEVGALDAVADIAAVCFMLDLLSPERIIASPVNTGSGSVKCAHGILPVPAPATAELLKGIPSYGGDIESELCTPTGAALLSHFAEFFGSMPVMKTEKIGVGAGKKDFEKANCVRAFLGESEGETDRKVELVCNVDDMTAEEISFAQERLLSGGAADVFTVPAGMKKSRLGTQLTVLCEPDKKDEIIKLIFRYTNTIGIRESEVKRYVLNREIRTFQTPYGEVRIKVSRGYGVERSKIEYDDAARVAASLGVSLEEARRLINEAVYG